jgi:hypothetical protein
MSMTRWLIVILVIALVGDLVGLFVMYKYFGAKRSIGYGQAELQKAYDAVEDLTDVLDRTYATKMVFLHHSVGRGILYDGGLRDSLLDMGILVKGATYGDAIGQETDINHWAPKFQRDMERILRFKSHPDRYYSGDRSNDIVMFKSCFPNSDIAGPGSEVGDAFSNEKTVANYKATFLSLREEFQKQPDRLFLYLTSPPLLPSRTSAENAERAREFNSWLLNEFLPQYQESTGLQNLAIFDLFSFLADQDNVLKAEYRLDREGNSHPNIEGSRAAAVEIAAWVRSVWVEWSSTEKS